MKLTKAALDAICHRPDKGKHDIHWDDDLPGFGARVWPSGKITFVVFYRSGPRKRLMTLGAYGVLTVQQARDMARSAMVDAKKGADPLAARREAKTRGVTVAAYAKVYLERHGAKKRDARDRQRYVTARITPALGRLRLEDVRPTDVARLFEKISADNPTTANRVLALLRHMFNQAKAPGWNYLPPGTPNPTEGIKFNPEAPRSRYVTKAEMPTLITEIQAIDNLWHRVALWTYLLTGRRKAEVLRLRWTDFDPTEQTLRFTLKGGAVKVMPISDFNAQLITGLPRLLGNPYIFCGKAHKKPVADVRYHWDKIRGRVTSKDLKVWQSAVRAAEADNKPPPAKPEHDLANPFHDVRLHDLRHTLASWVVSSGKTLELVGAILGHTQAKTTKRYAHLMRDPVIGALNEHADALRALMASPSDGGVVDVHASPVPNG
jgi:integrase